MSDFSALVPDILPVNRVVSGFTTREGGVSHPPFDSLNLGFSTSDNSVHVRENHTNVYRSNGVDKSNVALMEQVHGTEVKEVHSGGVSEETDALVTNVEGILLGVIVADCIPLLLYDPSACAAGAIHCGWRPVTGGIAEKTIGIMSELYGTEPGEVIAVLGPSAGPCCYEIGDDVAQLLDSAAVVKRDGRLYGDLKAELCKRLSAAGIRKNHIERFDDCTVCNERHYFSYRRDGTKSGRMMGYIMIRS